MSVLIGLAAAGSFGSGDFLGGFAARRSPTIAVLALSQCCAVALAVAFVVGAGGDPTARDLALGAGGGLGYVVGLGCFYRGLATGRMGVIAPATAVGGALVPIAWGLGTGARPSDVAMVGVVLVVVAGGLIGRERDRDGIGAAPALAWAAAASVAFGAAFVCFAELDAASGMWPVLGARAAALVLVGMAAAAVSGPWFPVRGERRPSIGAGLLDVTGMALLVLALRREVVTVVAPVVALAPAFTVVFAWGFLREPVGRIQLVGIAVALAGLALVAPG